MSSSSCSSLKTSTTHATASSSQPTHTSLEEFRKTWTEELQAKRSKDVFFDTKHMFSRGAPAPSISFSFAAPSTTGEGSAAAREEEEDEKSQLSSHASHNLSSGFDLATLKPVPKRPKSSGNEPRSLLHQLIADLDEVEDIPFFDTYLPIEVALRIFKHLTVPDLCHCSMVSKAWRHLANDNTLWYRHAINLALVDPFSAEITEESSWKSFVAESIKERLTQRRRWLEQAATFKKLHHPSIQRKSLRTLCRFGTNLLCTFSDGSSQLRSLDGADTSAIVRSLEHAPAPLGTSERLISALSSQHAAMASITGLLDIWDLDTRKFEARVSCPGGITSVAIPPSKHMILATFNEFDDNMVASTSLMCFSRHDDGEWREGWSKAAAFAGEGEEFLLGSALPLQPTVQTLDDRAFVTTTRHSVSIWCLETGNLLHEVFTPTPGVYLTSNVTLHPSSLDPLKNCGRTVLPRKLLFTTSHLGTNMLQMFDTGSERLVSMPIACQGKLVEYGRTGTSEQVATVVGGSGIVQLYDLRSQQRLERFMVRGYDVNCIQSDEWKFVVGARPTTTIAKSKVELWDWRMHKRALWSIPSPEPVRFLFYEGAYLFYGSASNVWTSSDFSHGALNMLDFESPMSEFVDAANPFSSAYEDPLAYSANLFLETPYEEISNPYGLG